MMILLNLGVFVLILGSIIAIHELGHLIFAKKAGILCYEYSLGFGPKLYNKKGKETEFSVRAIPLGGFVSMAGELASEMFKEGQFIGLNFEDGKVKEIILTDRIKAELTMKVTKFEVYDEKQTGYLFVEGMVLGNLEHYEILETANYIVNEKQKLQISPYKRSFESKTYIQKLLTLLAGPGMNFLLAILLFFVVAAVQGKPQNTNVIGDIVGGMPANTAEIVKNDKITAIGDTTITKWNEIEQAYLNLSSYESVEIEILRNGTTLTKTLNLAIEITQLGIANYNASGVLGSELNEGAIVGTSYAKTADILKANDIITSVNYQGVVTPITNWHDLIEVVKTLDGKTLEVTIIRESETLTKTIEVWEHKVLKSQGVTAYDIMLGITPERKFSLTYSLTQPFISAWDSFYQVVSVVVMLFGGSSQVGVGDLSGPIGIFNIIGQVMSQGWIALLAFAAFLSVNVGVLNLLPIPALDGGRILFISIEGVTRRKISKNVENIINNIFFFLLMALLIYVTFNDILRLF